MDVIVTTPVKLEMTLPVRTNLRAQAEMMSFLVVSHLATKFATHRWMSIEDAVASSSYWSKSMQRDEDVVLRVILGNRALSTRKQLKSRRASHSMVVLWRPCSTATYGWTSRLSLLATSTTGVSRIFLWPSRAARALDKSRIFATYRLMTCDLMKSQQLAL